MIRRYRHAKPLTATGLALVFFALAGCSLLPDNIPFDAQGMPAASQDEVADMFDIDPTKHPDGAPKEARHKGAVVGTWQPVSATSQGCIEYQLVPDPALNLMQPDVTHFWHGDLYRTEKKGCQPVAEIVHDEADQVHAVSDEGGDADY